MGSDPSQWPPPWLCSASRSPDSPATRSAVRNASGENAGRKSALTSPRPRRRGTSRLARIASASPDRVVTPVLTMPMPASRNTSGSPACSSTCASPRSATFCATTPESVWPRRQ